MSNVVDFNQAKLLTKPDNGPKDPTGPNWLSELDVGTIFLCRPKNAKSFELVTVEVLSKTRKSAYLKNTGMEDASVKVVVDSAIFSAMMELVEIVGYNAGPNKEEQDGNSDRAGESSGVSDPSNA